MDPEMLSWKEQKLICPYLLLRSGHHKQAFQGQDNDHVNGHCEGHLGYGEGDGDQVGGHCCEMREGEEHEGHDDADGVRQEQSYQHLAEGVRKAQLSGEKDW